MRRFPVMCEGEYYGPYAGHPLDPRTDAEDWEMEEDEDDEPEDEPEEEPDDEKNAE